MLKKIKFGGIVAMGLSCAGAALAQSSATLYGVIDTGIVTTTNANANGNTVTKMSALTGELPSRIGFKGVEDLGDGMQALIALESGFSPDTGTSTQGGRLFGRQSYVGLKNSWGQVTLGRQINMTFLSAIKADVLGPNIFSVASLDGYWPNARSDNAIGYLGTFANVTLGATYSLGRDTAAAGGPGATNCGGEVAGNAKACRQITALLGYDNQTYGVSTSYDIMYGNTGAAGGLTGSGNTDQRIILSGYVMLGATRIGGGVLDRKTRAAGEVHIDSDLWFLGTSTLLSAAWVLDGQIARLDIKGSNNDSTMTVARLTCHLSKRTAVYSSIGYMQNAGTAALALDGGGTVGTGKNQTGIMLGVKHMF